MPEPQDAAAMAAMDIACRSLLMTCALFPERYGRAAECGADIGTVDLEDSVPAGRKEEARRLALSYLAAPAVAPALPALAATPEITTVRALRVNSLRSEDGMRDLLAVLESGARPDILFLPKVESPEEVALPGEVLAGRLPETMVLATIETARGLAAVERMAAAGVPRLWGFIFGAFDYSVDVGSSLAWEDLLYARSRILNAAAGAGLPVVDAPCFDLDDAGALAGEVERGRRMGFAGKAAVHPRQVAAINEGFTPDAAAIEEAREILASAAAGGGICVVRGRMIGPPSVRLARRLLSTAERLTVTPALATLSAGGRIG
jgi:(S)-citramalyl-CoA lyase